MSSAGVRARESMPSNKRQAATAKVDVRKRQKIDPIEAKCVTVCHALDDEEAIPPVVQCMLTDMLQYSLGVSMDQRHRFQSDVVDMIASVMNQIDSKLQGRIHGEEQNVAGMSDEKRVRQAEVEQAAQELQRSTESSQEKKYALAGMAVTFKNAKQALLRAEVAQAEAERDIIVAAADKSVLQEMQKTLAWSMEQCVSEEERASLINKSKPFNFDDTMMMALPKALSQQPSARGQFDAMVLSQFQDDLSERIANLDEIITAAEPLKLKLKDSAHVAENALAVARKRLEQHAFILKAAQVEQGAAEEKLEAAKLSLRSVGPEIRKMERALAKAKNHLTQFRNGPLSAFEELEQRVISEGAVGPAGVAEEVDSPHEAEERNAAIV